MPKRSVKLGAWHELQHESPTHQKKGLGIQGRWSLNGHFVLIYRFRQTHGTWCITLLSWWDVFNFHDLTFSMKHWNSDIVKLYSRIYCGTLGHNSLVEICYVWEWNKTILLHIRATSHVSQEPWPCNVEDPWLSSKGHTMGVGKAILGSHGPSSIFWSDNGPCCGTIVYFVGGKGEEDLVQYNMSQIYKFERTTWWCLSTWNML